MKHVCFLFFSIVMVFTDAHSGTTLAEDDPLMISLYYVPRTPYFYQTKDNVKGLCADVVNYAFTKSGISYIWYNVPAKRQMTYIKKNIRRLGMVGWYKNAEREKFAKYSDYIYKDKTRIAVAHAHNEKLTNGKTVGDVISNPNIEVLIKTGYSYGKFLDAQLAKYNPKTISTMSESVNMIRMIHARRADLLFMSQEEASAIIKESGLPAKDFQFVTFSDMPQGYKRYIMFSKKVEDKIINKINKYIIEYREKESNQ